MSSIIKQYKRWAVKNNIQVQYQLNYSNYNYHWHYYVKSTLMEKKVGESKH